MTKASFGASLRSLREAAGLSLAALAARTHYSKAVLGHVETGKRNPSPDLASACDRALGTAPLLATLVETSVLQEASDVKRRALLSTIAAAVGVGGLAGADALADVLRQGLLASANASEDWDAVVQDYSRRAVTSPGSTYGQSLLAQLMVARQQQLDHGPDLDRARAIAHLAQLYGLWVADSGDVPGARGWYRTSAALADHSGDTPTRAYVRGLALSQGVYEGNTVRETMAGVNEVLSLSGGRRPTRGTLEAQSALVHVHALTGNLSQGRAVVDDMRRTVEQMADPDDGTAVPYARTVVFRNYLECRIGSRVAADAAFAEAEDVTRSLPVWHADASISYGRALVRSGDVSDGVRLGLDAARSLGPSLRTTMRVVGLGVRDLLDAVPVDYCTDEAEELATYAANGPAPWETIR